MVADQLTAFVVFRRPFPDGTSDLLAGNTNDRNVVINLSWFALRLRSAWVLLPGSFFFVDFWPLVFCFFFLICPLFVAFGVASGDAVRVGSTRGKRVSMGRTGGMPPVETPIVRGPTG